MKCAEKVESTDDCEVLDIPEVSTMRMMMMMPVLYSLAVCLRSSSSCKSRGLFIAWTDVL